MSVRVMALMFAVVIVACGGGAGVSREVTATPIAAVAVASTASATATASAVATIVATAVASTPTLAAVQPTAAVALGRRVSDIRYSTFEADFSVAAGSTVVWVNRDGVAHTVTSNDLRVDSPFMTADEEFAMTFSVAGRFEYFCRVHAGMAGAVVIRPQP